MLIKIKNFVKFWLNCTNFNQSKIKRGFPDPLSPTSDIKNSFFGRSYFIHSYGEGKIKPTVLVKIATQTVVSSHVVDKIIPTIAHASIKTMTKNWHIITKRDLLHIHPKKFHDFRS